MPDPGLIGAAIGGDAIAEVCIRKPSAYVKKIGLVRKTVWCVPWPLLLMFFLFRKNRPNPWKKAS